MFSARRTVLFFSLVRKEPKVPEGLRPSRLPGTIQISARFVGFAEMTDVHHVTGRAKICSVTGYRRWGFESVRKGYLCADARLQSFEKESSFCKLTVDFRGWNLRLHVSLGAVENWNFSVLRKGFSLSVGFAWAEKTGLFRKTKLHLKATLFHKPNAFQFTQAFLFCPQTPPYSTNQKLSIWTSLSLLFSKALLFLSQKLFFYTGLSLLSQATLFCPPSPIRTQP